MLSNPMFSSSEIVDRSYQILNKLIEKNSFNINLVQNKTNKLRKKNTIIEDKVLSELKKINPDKLSPIEALKFIYNIKKNIE